MAASPGRQMPTNSFHVIRSPIAVLTVAPFSPDRDFKSPSRHRLAKTHWGSIIPRKGAGFESGEPTSPEVGCMGQIKLKQKWTKASEHRAEKKPGRTAKGTLSKLVKFIFGNRGGPGDCGAGSGDCRTEKGCRVPYPVLGQLQRYASGSYDAEFGDTFTPQKLFVAPSRSVSE